jgi:hypothetical protein
LKLGRWEGEKVSKGALERQLVAFMLIEYSDFRIPTSEFKNPCHAASGIQYPAKHLERVRRRRTIEQFQQAQRSNNYTIQYPIIQNPVSSFLISNKLGEAERSNALNALNVSNRLAS